MLGAVLTVDDAPDFLRVLWLTEYRLAQRGELAVDLARALGHLGGDRELFDDVAATILETGPDAVAGLALACSQAAAHGLNAAAHSLQEAGSNTCASLIERLARQWESMGYDAQLEMASTILADLEHASNRIPEFLGALGR